MNNKPKLIRTSTIAASLNILLKGQLAFLNKHYEVVAVSGGDAHLEALRVREHVRVAEVTINRSISPVKDVVSLIELFFLFRKEKPQIVHSITPKAGLLSMIAAYFAGVPFRIHTFTGLIFPYKTGFMHSLLLFMDKVLCGFATHIYPEGEGVKQDLITYKVTSKPLTVLANGNVNGIDLSYFDPQQVVEDQKQSLKALLEIKISEFVFVYVGRLVGDKGINELITAFVDLQKENSYCKLLLVGDYEKDLDPLNSHIMTQIENNQNIISVGFQQDIRPYLSISDVFVFPSYREGFPNVVLQACAMELPCIVTDISGSNEIIKEYYNGLIVPVKNSNLLFQKMKLLLDDPALRLLLASNTRNNVVKKYEQRTVWNALIEEYNKLELHV